MERYGISVNLKNIPELDPDFMPLARYNEAFLENAEMDIYTYTFEKYKDPGYTTGEYTLIGCEF